MAASPESRGLAAALIVAAGSGERLGAGGPKALVPVAGRPMFEHSLIAFRAAASVGPVVVVVPPGHEDQFRDALDPERAESLVAGGPARSLSVANGLAALDREGADCEIVAVHDAARPLVAPELIDRSVEMLEKSADVDAVIAAAPVTDTIKKVAAGGRVEQTVDRSALRAVQTPQVFRRSALAAALAAGDPESATDDASLVEDAGGSVVVIDAPSFNIKVTVPEDLAIAEALIGDRD